MNLPAREEMSSPEALQILIVDDSALYRRILSDAVKKIDGIEVVATSSGPLALKRLALQQIDLVLLDIEMPEMSGLEVLRAIRRDFPDVEVVMVSGSSERSASITVEALAVGALDFIPKPTGRDPGENSRRLSTDLRSVIDLVKRRPPVHGASPGGAVTALPRPIPLPRPQDRPAVPTAPVPTRYAALGIGVSTGGPQALDKLITALPGDFPLPILLVQHMPPAFTQALAKDLNRKAKLEVKEAAEGDVAYPGRVLIAPGGRHLTIRPSGGQVLAAINDGPKENSCRPSVDVLFRSMASCYQARGVLALVMTGMGSDGLRGIQALKKVGCRCLTQSASTCSVYGMPQAVDTAGLSDESVDLERLASRLVTLGNAGGTLP